MLPSLRTVLAAMFVTATLVTLVGTALTPVFPRVEQPRVWLARTENPNEQARLVGYARFSDESNRPRTADPSSSASEIIDSGISTSAKTLVRVREGPPVSGVHDRVSALAPEEPAVNSNKSVNVAETGSVNSPSIASGKRSAPLRGSTASFTNLPKRSAHQCVFCHRLHAYGTQQRSGHWRRVRMTLDRNSAL